MKRLESSAAGRGPSPRRARLAKLSAFALLTTVAASAWAQTKVAVVDTQRAIMETEDGLRMQATLKKLFDSKQRELDQKQNQLEQERADIEKQKSALSQEALQRRAEKWQREMMALQQVFVEYNKELQKKQNELTQPIFTKAMGLMRRLATQEGFDLIIDKQAVPYVRSDLDVTDRVITMYNGGAAPTAPKEGASDQAPKAAAPAAPAAPGLQKP
jgi:outer membrane protein